MRYSQKREIIKAAVMYNRIHPTAEEVYNLVHQEHPEISLGTVYRDLNQLAEEGEIIKISIADGPDRYDGTLSNHQHAICTGCGKVMDFDFDTSEILAALSDQIGMKAESCSVNVKGLCRQCADKI